MEKMKNPNFQKIFEIFWGFLEISEIFSENVNFREFPKFFQVSSVPGQPRVEDLGDFNRILIGFPCKSFGFLLKSFGFLSKSFQILSIPFNSY